ncbi:MAG TPA: arginase family protein [Thermoanaerobaculia bacterium]|jgi:arginase
MSGKTVEVIVVPYDVERRDTEMARAPRELLARGFPDRLREAGWEVHLTEIEDPPVGASKEETVIAVGRGISGAVARARSQGRFPLVLSGGCLAAVGVVAGLQRLGRDPGVVWIDAHGDFNTPGSSPSGYWDGMALAAICGRSLPEVSEGIGLRRPIPLRDVVHLAGRDFDPPEAEDARRLGLAAIPAERICDEPSIEQLRGRAAARELYLHVDLDGLDPQDAPAVSVPVPGGARLAELLRCLTALPAPAAMTFSALGFDQASDEEAARTLETCARLVDACAPARA